MVFVHHTFDSMSWDKPSLQILDDSRVAIIWERTIYNKVICIIITKVVESLPLLMQVANLLIEVIRIHGNTDIVI